MATPLVVVIGPPASRFAGLRRAGIEIVLAPARAAWLASSRLSYVSNAFADIRGAGRRGHGNVRRQPTAAGSPFMNND